MSADHYHLLPLLIGIVRTEEGEIRWPVVISGVALALITGMGAAVVSQGKEIARVEARQMSVLERLDKIESGAVMATNDRYRRSDAERDLAGLEARTEKRLERLERFHAPYLEQQQFQKREPR
jgi:hypothetical protein